jgi:hypothetical protein
MPYPNYHHAPHKPSVGLPPSTIQKTFFIQGNTVTTKATIPVNLSNHLDRQALHDALIAKGYRFVPCPLSNHFEDIDSF